jgi:alpha-amylase
MAVALMALVTAAAAAGCASKRDIAPPGVLGAGEPDAKPVLMVPNASALPRGWWQGALLQVPVRRFQDSNGDGVGDLRGVIQRLDALRDMGVRGLVLSSLAAIAGDDTEAVIDHRRIDPALGTTADFDALLREAHGRGMGVMLDYGLNHSAATHRHFEQAVADAKSNYRQWYVWSLARPVGWEVSGENPWYPAASKPWQGDSPGLGWLGGGGRDFYFASLGPKLPDYNFRNRQVLAFHADNLRFWLNRGVDGVRFTGVNRLVENGPNAWFDQPQSRDVAGHLSDRVRAYPGRHVVCDATGSPQIHADAAFCGGAIAHDLSEPLQRAARGDAAAMRAVFEYWRRSPRSMAVTATPVAALAPDAAVAALAAPIAAALQVLMPGTPWLVHGVDVDHAPGALEAQTSMYRELLAVRNARVSVQSGTFETVTLQRGLSGFLRIADNERTLVLINQGRSSVEVDLSSLPKRARMTPLYPRQGGSSFVAEVLLIDNNGKVSVNMPPGAVRVFDIEVRSR